MAKKRSIKVYGQSGYKYRETPTIMLKGQWLKEAGFDIGDYITVTCENGKLVIAQDAERAAVKAAEAEYMEREMKALQKRYEAERIKIRAQMVAEAGARW
ncbi:MAG: SymE family type I addiction module toxin [Eubacterium sp.]|nr:SymE family type I addiction module toxin [Eubacterium sp.]